MEPLKSSCLLMKTDAVNAANKLSSVSLTMKTATE